jgi:hypothetical protein
MDPKIVAMILLVALLEATAFFAAMKPRTDHPQQR